MVLDLLHILSEFPFISLLGKLLNIVEDTVYFISSISSIFLFKNYYMNIKMPKMTNFGAIAIPINVWTKCDEKQKPNSDTMSVYSLPLYDLKQK